MTTRINIRSRDIGYRKLVSYRDSTSERITIEAKMTHVFFVEEGVSSRGSKKERQDVGEAPHSVRFSSLDEKLKVYLFNGIMPRGNSWYIRLSLGYLNKLALHCKKKKHGIEKAYSYFYEKIYRKNSEQIGWNQYEIDEEKNKAERIGSSVFKED